jgi:hypothetical protein
MTAPKRAPSLFDNLRDEPEEPKPQKLKVAEWIDRLFASPVYKNQKGVTIV